MIKIINSATLSSFQDLGRFGKKSIGVSQSGCLDKFSFLISNFLCGNKKNEGAIEIVGGGFSCEFKEDVSVAVSGPTGVFMINNNQISINSSIRIKKNDTLYIPENKHGNIFYFSISGGFNVGNIMNSVSFHQPSNITNDLRVKIGDILHMKKPNSNFQKLLNFSFFDKYIKSTNIISIIYDEIILNKFPDFINILESNQYIISAEASRQGIRLKGNDNLSHKLKNEISSGVSLGTVQLPPNGQPIILLNDSQTTGGYLKLGSIPNFEIPKLSQTNINSKIRFKGISLSDSNNLRKKIDSKFNSIKLEDYFLYNHRIKNNHISVQISENDSIISIANEQLINVLKE
ncbi:MAG: hypothetical protein FI682_05650 [SAR202 cluster bacterium]|nr:hypothetical protein [SAR202 cluster bacterium]